MLVENLGNQKPFYTLVPDNYSIKYKIMIDYNFKESLKKALKSFDPQSDNLDSQFAELAKWFLYGGYIHVKNNRVDRKVYIREVEFYFYDEKEIIPSNKIVYHRNDNYANIPDNDNLPIGKSTRYFDTGTLYLHASGVDITFENETKRYRASALIRAFAVEEKGTIQTIYKNQKIDPRSTFVYEYLFEGLSVFDDSGYSIKWVDDWQTAPSTLQGHERIGVVDKESGNKDNKRWRFKRFDL